jgi:hypothetical protein
MLNIPEPEIAIPYTCTMYVCNMCIYISMYFAYFYLLFDFTKHGEIYIENSELCICMCITEFL